MPNNTNHEEIIKSLSERLGIPESSHQILSSYKTKFFDGRLMSLNLSRTLLEKVPNSSFGSSQFQYLTDLLISHNKLEALDRELKPLNHLTILWAHQNRISELSSATFQFNPNLTALYLNKNQVKDLPSNIFVKNPNLQELRLSHNKIEDIPKGLFVNLHKLHTLTLHQNPLKAGFEELLALPALQRLYISWLPDEIETKLKDSEVKIFQR